MDWTSILLSAGAGLLAAILAGLVASRVNNKIFAVITFLVFFGLLRAVADDLVRPLTLDGQVRKAETVLLENPTFKALKEYDNATYQAIMGDVRKGLEHNTPLPDIQSQVRGHLLATTKRRLASSSDAAISRYMRVTTQEARLLGQKDPALCHEFLVGSGTPSGQLPHDVLEEDSAALAEIIRTSAQSPTPLPTQAAITPDLQRVLQQLQQRHGADVLVVQQLNSPGVDKAKACTVVSDFYEAILALPPERSGPLLRFLLAQAA